MEYPETTKEEWVAKNDIKPIFEKETKDFVAFVNIAQRAIERKLGHDFIVNCLMEYKNSVKLGSQLNDCSNGIIFDKEHVTDFIEKINMTYNTTVDIDVPDLALSNGFELYASFFFCPQNIYTDLVLQDFFLDLNSPSSMLQGLANVINSGLIANSVNKEHLRQFSEMLQTVCDMDLEFILSKTLTNKDKLAMAHNQHPLLLNSSGKIEQQNDKTESLMAELSSHPVHLMTKNGWSALSAFIPFCAYQTNMLVVGEYIDGFDFPVCNKFTPTVHRGQLCYTIDISSVLPNTETDDGKAGGLTLILDYNTERSVQPAMNRKGTNENTEKIHLNLEDAPTEEDGEARIFIHTLKPFKGYGGGSFSMNALKQISPTEKFLELPDTVKGCKNNDKQHCKMTLYLKQKVEECNCIPWEFPQRVTVSKVETILLHLSCFFSAGSFNLHLKRKRLLCRV